MLLLLAWLWIQIEAWFDWRLKRRHFSRSCRRSVEPVCRRSQAKPAWVIREVIRLKALMPGVGPRTLALAFNRRYAYMEGGS